MSCLDIIDFDLESVNQVFVLKLSSLSQTNHFSDLYLIWLLDIHDMLLVENKELAFLVSFCSRVSI
jgi:hypothetical protein